MSLFLIPLRFSWLWSQLVSITNQKEIVMKAPSKQALASSPGHHLAGWRDYSVALSHSLTAGS
jgi:hypothetical protein